MPPSRKKKPFIDKKNAVKFHLVHRSQRDPLQADEEAPKRVLLEAGAKQQEEQKLYGIYYDDDYDYMQHLKDVSEIDKVELSSVPENVTFRLPSEVFASATETEVGLLNKAVPLKGPQLDWDPDIVAGLDEDFDYDNPDNILGDDFMNFAMGNKDISNNHDEDSNAKSYQNRHEENEYIDSDDAQFSDNNSEFSDEFYEEETKSRFTSYSMTSSVIRRNEGLTLLDDRFEKIYEQYDDEEIGPLEQEEIVGAVRDNSDLLASAMEEFEETTKITKLKDIIGPYDGKELRDSSSDDENLVNVEAEEKPKEKWDCESILSTYSNIYNHPKTITEPKRIKMKMVEGMEIPADVLSKRGLTKKQLEEHQSMEIKHREFVPTYRPHDETKDEKKVRKQAVKNERRTRRKKKKVPTATLR